LWGLYWKGAHIQVAGGKGLADKVKVAAAVTSQIVVQNFGKTESISGKCEHSFPFSLTTCNIAFFSNFNSNTKVSNFDWS